MVLTLSCASLNARHLDFEDQRRIWRNIGTSSLRAIRHARWHVYSPLAALTHAANALVYARNNSACADGKRIRAAFARATLSHAFTCRTGWVVEPQLVVHDHSTSSDHLCSGTDGQIRKAELHIHLGRVSWAAAAILIARDRRRGYRHTQKKLLHDPSRVSGVSDRPMSATVIVR